MSDSRSPSPQPRAEADAVEFNKRPVSHQIRDYTEPLTQLSETAGMAFFGFAGLASTFPSHSYPNGALTWQANSVSQSILDGLPIFALIKGILSIIDGATFAAAGYEGFTDSQGELRFFHAKGDVFFFVSSRERYARGILQTVSGMILAEGGVEAICKVDPTLQYLNLPWRYAIHSMLEFLTSIIDLFHIGQMREHATDDEKVAAYSYLRSGAISRFITKGFACAGWTTLAVCGMSNPIGWGCIAAASLSASYMNVPRAFSFFKDVAADLSEHGPKIAMRNLCPR